MSEQPFNDFEEFWPYFLSSHRKAGTRWAHVVLVAIAARGAVNAARRGSLKPLLGGAAAASAIASFSHHFIEGSRPERRGNPLWAARALGRLVVRTVTGSINADLEKLQAQEAAAAAATATAPATPASA
jgi:hypothetical protein